MPYPPAALKSGWSDAPRPIDAIIAALSGATGSASTGRFQTLEGGRTSHAETGGTGPAVGRAEVGGTADADDRGIGEAVGRAVAAAAGSRVGVAVGDAAGTEGGVAGAGAAGTLRPLAAAGAVAGPAGAAVAAAGSTTTDAPLPGEHAATAMASRATPSQPGRGRDERAITARA